MCLQHLLVRSWNRTGNLFLMPKKTFSPPLVLFMKKKQNKPLQAYFLIINQRIDSLSEYRSRSPLPLHPTPSTPSADRSVHIWLLWACPRVRVAGLLACVSTGRTRVSAGQTAVCGAAELVMCDIVIGWFGLLGGSICVWKTSSPWHLYNRPLQHPQKIFVFHSKFDWISSVLHCVQGLGRC